MISTIGLIKTEFLYHIRHTEQLLMILVFSGLCLTPLSVTPFNQAPVGQTNCVTNGGYVWWIFPPFATESGVIPQQFVYTPSLRKPPTSRKDLEMFLQTNDLYSLFVDGQGQLELRTMLIEGQIDPNSNPRNSQLVDYQLYNIILRYNTYDPGGIAYPAGQWNF